MRYYDEELDEDIGKEERMEYRSHREFHNNGTVTDWRKNSNGEQLL